MLLCGEACQIEGQYADWRKKKKQSQDHPGSHTLVWPFTLCRFDAADKEEDFDDSIKKVKGE